MGRSASQGITHSPGHRNLRNGHDGIWLLQRLTIARTRLPINFTISLSLTSEIVVRFRGGTGFNTLSEHSGMIGIHLFCKLGSTTGDAA
jgi:hypothetical protein